MKTIKIAALALMLCASVMTYAKPKKGVKAQNNTSVVKLDCTVESDGTVKNTSGEAIGKLNSDGNVVNAAGQVIGTMQKTSAQKIQEVYFND